MQTDPDKISEVFGCFYEDLYKETDPKLNLDHDGSSDPELLITASELSKALKRMKSQRTGADDGLVAEMLKTNHPLLMRCALRGHPQRSRKGTRDLESNEA